MNLDRVNIVLFVLLLLTAAIAFSMQVDPSQPNVEFLPEMKRSPAYGTFAANPVLPGGRTLQTPVAGTIPRGDLPLYYAASKEDAVRAGEELQNPFAAEAVVMPLDSSSTDDLSDNTTDQQAANEEEEDSAEELPDPQAALRASIQRGSQVYAVFCTTCHGVKGAGDGSVTKRGFPPPPPLTTGKSVQMQDGQLFHILTYGQGSMSSMAAQVDRERRWDVINYVRSMQQAANVVAPATGDAATPSADTELSNDGLDEAAEESAESPQAPLREEDQDQSQQAADGRRG